MKTKKAALPQNFNPSKLRNEYFNKKYLLDNELINILDIKPSPDDKRKIESHDFLKNPLIQYIHIYLVEYVIGFSKMWFNRENNIKMLDWGCGKGQVSYLCKKRNINIISCDIENKNAGDSYFGQYTPIIEHSKIDVIPLKHPYELPFNGETFDVVLSFGVLEHVSNDFESLKEINRILTNKGLFFCFFLPYTYSWRQNLEHMKGNTYHDHLYNYKTVQEKINRAEMEIIDYWYRDVVPFRSHIPFYKFCERMDNWVCKNSPLKFFASNIEFVACKKKTRRRGEREESHGGTEDTALYSIISFLS